MGAHNEELYRQIHEDEAQAKRRASEAEQSRKEADRRRAQDAADAKAAEADAIRRKCDQSRAARLAAAKEQIKELAAWSKENGPRVRYFMAHCGHYDSRGIKVTKEHTSDGGVILRTAPVGTEWDVKCDGAPGRPAGIDSKWSYEFQYHVERNDDAVDGSGECAKSDFDALGTNINVARSDQEGLARIMSLP